MSPELREKIKERLTTSLRQYVTKFVYKNSQPLDLLIPTERKVRSVVGGLETSMGTTVWEPIATILAEANGFEVLKEKILKPSPFPEALAHELTIVMNLREHRDTWISAQECVTRLRKVAEAIDQSSLEYVRPSSGTGVDVYFRKEGTEYAYDIKTVQPNVGSIKSFNKQILEWYAYRLCKDPTANIECKIAYPYNPFVGNFWARTPHTGGVMQTGVDAVVEDEFWDFLSGMTGTYAEITDIFKELNAEGFGEELTGLIEKIKTPAS